MTLQGCYTLRPARRAAMRGLACAGIRRQHSEQGSWGFWDGMGMSDRDETGQGERPGEAPSLAQVAAQFPRPALGRSEHLHRLFDYLLAKSEQGETCREIDIAIDIFGKSGADALIDASTRVYIHRLRKKMEEYYAGPGAALAHRLVIPKGEYRLAVETSAESARPVAPPVDRPPRPKWPNLPKWSVALPVLLAAMAGAVAMLAVQRLRVSDDGLDAVRQSALWRPFLTAHRPLTIVPGDYYIMGEQDEMELAPHRLVRDFAINSREDLDRAMLSQPELRGRYIDLNLHYLPVSSGDGIGTMMRIVAPSLSARRQAQILTASRLSAAQLRGSDILFVGLLSGLGPLRKPIFGNSRFTIGDSYDEVIDRSTRKIYSADPPRGNDVARRDYAYVAAVPGPNGNRILIAAGTRDPALLQAIDILRTPGELAKLDDVSGNGFFEALYAVDGVGEDRFQSRLIAASPRATTGIWEAMPNLPGTISRPQ